FVSVATGDRAESSLAATIDPAAGAWRAGTYRVVTLTPETFDGTPFDRESNAASLDVVPRLVSVGVNGGAPVTDPGPGTGPSPTPPPPPKPPPRRPGRRAGGARPRGRRPGGGGGGGAGPSPPRPGGWGGPPPPPAPRRPT